MRANYERPKAMGGQNLNAMLQQAQKMQEEMAAKQAELEEREYEISAGGGAVTLKINGKKQILSLDIAPEIVDPDDIETLSDLITAAVNEAISKVTATNEEEKNKLSSQLSIPGVF